MARLPFSGWEAFEAQLTPMLAQVSFDQRTIANTHDLVSLCRDRCAAPGGLDKGYWDTISLSWPDVEVEVFPDRFEFYRFYDQRAQIAEFSRQHGEPVPKPLIELLPPRVPGGS